MAGRIAPQPGTDRSGDGTPEFALAAGENHHMNLGPGSKALAEYEAAGLSTPDLDAIRTYRQRRVREQLDAFGYDGVLVMDPMNIRYITDTTNMQLWVMHNAARYAFMAADGTVVLWDYDNCQFLSGHHDGVTEVRSAIGTTYFLAGDRFDEIAQRWADDMAAVVETHCGKDARIAVDQVNFLEGTKLTNHGILSLIHI